MCINVKDIVVETWKVSTALSEQTYDKKNMDMDWNINLKKCWEGDRFPLNLSYLQKYRYKFIEWQGEYSCEQVVNVLDRYAHDEQ